jgi:hypothetical protein
MSLEVVDGLALPEELRRLLQPGGQAPDGHGGDHPLPRWFYRVDSWQDAQQATLAPFFALHEFLAVDVREPAALRTFPRYVPLGVTHLAAHLSLLRQHLGAEVHIAANGGYRSPAHALSARGSVHAWGTAANVYRIGGELLDSEAAITRYGGLVRRLLPGAWCRPYGGGPGGTIDHLHVDLGVFAVAPHGTGIADPG